MHKKNIVIIGCLAAGVYFAGAYWLQVAFDPRVTVDGNRLLLRRPYRTFLDSKFAAIAIDPRWRLIADSAAAKATLDAEAVRGVPLDQQAASPPQDQAGNAEQTEGSC